MEFQKVTMLLPHELLRLIAARSSLDKLLEKAAMVRMLSIIFIKSRIKLDFHC
jgi:hypothetical protein